MFEETSKLNAVDTKIKFRDFIRDLDVVDLCKKEYCISTSHAAPKKYVISNKTELLNKFKLGEALGNDLSSCQKECSALKADKHITKKQLSKCHSDCHKEYSQKGKISSSNELKDCRTKCIKNEEAIKNAAEEYYENKKEEMVQKVSDNDLKEYKALIKELIDDKYNKLIKDADEQLRKSKVNAEKMKEDKEKEMNLLKKESLVENQNVDAEKMKQELLDKIKEILSPKQEFLNLLVKENDVVDKVCKNDYCNKKGEKELSTCNLKCENSKDFGISNNQEYEECKTSCQKNKESEKQKCTERCDDKQEAIKSAAKEYSQEIKNNTSKEFDISKMKQGLLDKIQGIMEDAPSAEVEYFML